MRIRTLGRMAMTLTLLVASAALLVAATSEGQVTAVDPHSGTLTMQASEEAGAANWLPLVALLGAVPVGAALILRRTAARIDEPRGL